jgi:hypothetical protein
MKTYWLANKPTANTPKRQRRPEKTHKRHSKSMIKKHEEALQKAVQTQEESCCQHDKP